MSDPLHGSIEPQPATGLPPALWPPGAQDYVARARIARLGTVNPDGSPHLVPVCFAFDGRAIWSVIDEKPKRLAPNRLQRVRNILRDPRVTLLVDTYDEDWSRLGYVLIFGRGDLMEAGVEHGRAIELLRAKYPQYLAMALDDRPVIRVLPVRAIAWGRL